MWKIRFHTVGACVALGVMLPLVLTTLAGSAGAQPSGALYVAQWGSDSNACTHAKPCHTINHAISVAPRGGTVQVEPGTYHQSVIIEKPITLIGNDAIVDGWGLDPGDPLVGVVYIGGPGGTTASDHIGGDVTVSGFTFDNPNPDGQTAGDNPCLQPIIIGIYDGDRHDVITIANDHLVEGTQDPAAVYDGPVGIDSLVSWASLVVTNTTIDGVWQGILLEDNGKSTLSGNTVSDLIPFDVPNTSPTLLDSSPTESQQCVALAGEYGTTPYQAEGVLLLADDVHHGMTDQDVTNNTFSGYPGDGVDVASAYAAGHLSDVTVSDNSFDLGGFSGAGAINVVADNGGTVSGVTIKGNIGRVKAPTKTITENDNGGPSNGGGTISDVTRIGNDIAG